MAKKTMVGGFDGDWRKLLALLILLGSLGLLPKGWSRMIATAGGLAALIKLLRDWGLI